VDGTNGSWDRSKREGDRWEVCGHALSDANHPLPIKLMTALALYKEGYVTPRHGRRWNVMQTTELVITDKGRRKGQQPLKQAKLKATTFGGITWGVIWRIIIAVVVTTLLVVLHSFALRYNHRPITNRDTDNALVWYAMVVAVFYLLWLVGRSVVRRFPRREHWIFLAVWVFLTLGLLNQLQSMYGPHR